MRRHAQAGSFLVGLAWGVVIGFALMVTPVLWLGADSTMALYRQIAPRLHQLWQLTSHNLQGSIVPFIVVLLAYWMQLHQLRQLLAEREPELARVVRHEQLLDLCANLFFGIGVIWTAIGMRDGLLYALGDPGITATEGAFAILQRMVDGGILLALSTTIVGGIGGYLMRAIKSISLGRQVNAVYMRASQQPGAQNLAALQRIECLLGSAPEDHSQGSP
jgi:hypothetical protein